MIRFKNIFIFIILLTISPQVDGQLNFFVLNENSLRKEYCKHNPTKIIEIRIQKDSLGGNEYIAWENETTFKQGRVSAYIMSSSNRQYKENYNWQKTNNGTLLTRYDSTFYYDTSNLHRFGNDLSKDPNRQDTIVMFFGKNGNITSIIRNNEPKGISYMYNKQGDLVNYKTSDYEIKWENKYNTENKIVESKVFKQGEMTDCYRMFYAHNEEKIYRISYRNGQPNSVKKNYSYYRSNNSLKTKVEIESKVGLAEKSKMEYTYDDQGNVIYQVGSTIMNTNPQLGSDILSDNLHYESMKYEYKYDDKNNWVERIIYIKENDDKTFRWFNKDLRIVEY